VGLLRLFLAWRRVRLCIPLLLCGALLLMMSSSLSSIGRGDDVPAQRSVPGAVAHAERAVRPLVLDARHALTPALFGGRPL
jgi:hypothetical protein